MTLKPPVHQKEYEKALAGILDAETRLCSVVEKAVRAQHPATGAPDTNVCDQLVSQVGPLFRNAQSFFHTLLWVDPAQTSDLTLDENADDNKSGSGARLKLARQRRSALQSFYSLADYLFILQPQFQQHVDRLASSSRARSAHGCTWVLSSDFMDPATFAGPQRTRRPGRNIPLVYRPPNEPISPATMALLLPSVSRHVWFSTQQFFRQLHSRPQLTMNVDHIGTSLRAVLDLLKIPDIRPDLIPDLPDVYEFSQAQEDFAAFTGNNNRASFQSAVKNRQVLSVLSWTGEKVFPAFQFRNKANFAIIRAVLSHQLCDPRDVNQNWSTAIYLQHRLQHGHPTAAVIQNDLEFVGQWDELAKPIDDDNEPQRILSDLSNADATAVLPADLFRVARDDVSPYYHEHASPSRRKAARQGRLSLHIQGAGTSYFAATGAGSWSEAMMAHLTMSLGDVLGRTFYHFRIEPCPGTPADSDIVLTDLTTPLLKNGTVADRHLVSQYLATRLVQRYPQRCGVKYPLKTATADDTGDGVVGYALWGPAEAHSPSTLSRTSALDFEDDPPKSRGMWSGDQDGVPALDDASGFAEYVTLRRKYFPHFPVALWRFPPGNEPHQ